MGEAGVFIATLTALAVLASMSRVTDAWIGTRLATIGMSVAAVYQAGGWLERWLHHEPANGGLFAGSLMLLLLCFLTVLGVDFFEHIREGRAELVSDILLVCTLTGAAEFLLQHTGTAGSSSLWSFTLLAATAAAAITSAIRWRPMSRIDDSGTRGVSYPGLVSAMAPDLITMPAVVAFSSENNTRPARASCARATACGSSALITAQSLSVWFEKILAFACAYSSNEACLSRWSGDRFRKTATHGWNVSMVSS